MPAQLAMTQNFENDAAYLLPDLMWDDINEHGRDPLVEALPLGYTDADMVKWDQYDDPWGVLPQRGLGNNPPLVTLNGQRTYEASPAYFGAYTLLGEVEMTSERQAGTIASPLDINERLSIMLQNFSTMVVSRIRKTDADLLLTGTFQAINAQGSLIDSYTVDDYQTWSPANDGNTGPGWAADPLNATPLNDQLYWQNQMQIGTSSTFGADTEMLCQQSVPNDLIKTAQVATTYKDNYGSSFLGYEGLNKLQQGFGLPKLTIYDYGYYPTLASAKNRTKADFVRVLPVKSLIWIGKRPKGQQIGQFKLTRHASILPPSNGVPKLVAQQTEYEWAQGLYVSMQFQQNMPANYLIQMGFNACPMLGYGSAAAGITYT